ncbi:hypothetical protein SDC9_107656 [bioreactor metagenome]|uniref:Uncharacterized protein n=1 Tax=bioreactor metagenome TaxID=1076179 RepID=A0A645B5V9_9ZZZZ
MIIELEKKYNSREIDKILRKMKSKKIFDSRRFAGKILGNEDPLVYQKRVRNEWD